MLIHRRRACSPAPASSAPLLARAQLGDRMAERSDPPPGGGGTARPGAAIGGQPQQQKKKKLKYPAGCPVVEVNETFDITEPSSGATITVRRTGEEVFSCAMPNCSQIFQVYTRNLSSMQSHATSKHKPIPVVSLAAASGTRTGQVGETITVVVAFGNIGDANISHDFTFKIAPYFSGPNQRGAKCTICGKVLAILADHQLQKHCDSDHPTAEVIDIRSRIAAAKRQAELAGVQEAERQSVGGGMARFFSARIAGPAPPSSSCSCFDSPASQPAAGATSCTDGTGVGTPAWFGCGSAGGVARLQLLCRAQAQLSWAWVSVYSAANGDGPSLGCEYGWHSSITSVRGERNEKRGARMARSTKTPGCLSTVATFASM